MPLADFSNAPSYDAIPAQRNVPATLEKFENGISSNDNEKIDLTFVVTDGEFMGRKFWRTLSLEPNALPYVKRVALALGADPSVFVGEVDTDDIFVDLVGAPCLLDITVEIYEGEKQNKVKSVKPMRFDASPASTGF